MHCAYVVLNIKNMSDEAVDYTFDTELDPESDYKNHSKLVDIPPTNKGFYWLIHHLLRYGTY